MANLRRFLVVAAAVFPASLLTQGLGSAVQASQATAVEGRPASRENQELAQACKREQETQKRYDRFFKSVEADRLLVEADAKWSAMEKRVGADPNAVEIMKVIQKTNRSANERVGIQLRSLGTLAQDYIRNMPGSNPLRKLSMDAFTQQEAIRELITEIVLGIPHLEALGLDKASASGQSVELEKQRERLKINKLDISTELARELERARRNLDPILVRSIVDAIELQVEAHAVNLARNVRLPSVAEVLKKQCMPTAGGVEQTQKLRSPAASALAH